MTNLGFTQEIEDNSSPRHLDPYFHYLVPDTPALETEPGRFSAFP